LLFTSGMKARRVFAMNDPLDKLGAVIKETRLQHDMTQEALAAKLDVSARHIMSIENGHQKPGYALLFRLICELSIPADRIFYPDAVHCCPDVEQIIAMLRRCGDKELAVITATLRALLKDM
jgi:transcriptional regulator with XRE-family HTH domain